MDLFIKVVVVIAGRYRIFFLIMALQKNCTIGLIKLKKTKNQINIFLRNLISNLPDEQLIVFVGCRLNIVDFIIV